MSSSLTSSTSSVADAEALFRRLLPSHDSTYALKVDYKDTFGKRFSFHFNVLDWALTVPSVGLEFDLNKTEMNNRSLLLFGKWNPKTKHTHQPRVRLDVMAARIEFRKYWRTGSVGKSMDHAYQPLNLKRGLKVQRYVKHYDDLLQREVTDTVEYYASENDSLLDLAYNGDPNASWGYNMYHKFRRNVSSSRTLRHPRNWRAYYLGAYASVDDYNICLRKKGRDGRGVSVGMTLGWSIPLLTRRFPREGGLDLDLGALVGVRAEKYDAYRYQTDTKSYVPDVARSKTSWTLSSNPLQELRVSLVYRFRSISRKVSLKLIDEYEKKWVRPYEERRDSRILQMRVRKDSLQALRRERALQERLANDSAAWANDWHKRRLANALLLNPDTVFVGVDDTLYHKVMEGRDFRTMSKRELKAYKDSVARAEKLLLKQQRQAAKQLKKQTKRRRKNTIMESQNESATSPLSYLPQWGMGASVPRREGSGASGMSPLMLTVWLHGKGGQYV